MQDDNRITRQRESPPGETEPSGQKEKNMNATNLSVPRSPLDVKTPSDIYSGHCPRCGQSLDICWRHVGGSGKVPYVCCASPDGGETPEHVLRRIPEALAYAYLDHLSQVGQANIDYARRLEADVPRSGFTDLDSLIKTACPNCGAAWEVIAVGLRYFARCVSPTCEGHGILHPIGRRLAQAWEDLAQAEDMANAEREEGTCQTH